MRRLFQSHLLHICCIWERVKSCIANEHDIFSIAELAPSTSLVDSLVSIPKGLDKPVKSKGRWTVYVQTGAPNDAGTKEKVFLVLCGLKGESDPIHINVKDDLDPGSFIKLEAKVSDIGLLFKVRVLFGEKPISSSWLLAKVRPSKIFLFNPFPHRINL